MEPLRYRHLQRIVPAAAAGVTLNVKPGVLWVSTVQLPLNQTRRSQITRQIDTEGVVGRTYLLSNYDVGVRVARLNTVGVILRGSLRNEAVWDLVDVGVKLLQVNAVRSRVGHIREDAPRQFSLDVEVPLLHVPRLIKSVAVGLERGL